MLNEVIYKFARWLDTLPSSTAIHESFYLYNWIEATHVLTLMLCLGMLFIIDLRMLGFALPEVPASKIAKGLATPMLIGFIVMFITGILLFYAIPVRSSQSLWLRIKIVLLVVAAINAYLFHRRMTASVDDWDHHAKAPLKLRIGAGLSIVFWIVIAICGRFIAYDWFDCKNNPAPFFSAVAGCIDGQTQF
ncbi:MAG: putative membrane protein [Paraglaciecola psychrophila]